MGQKDSRICYTKFRQAFDMVWGSKCEFCREVVVRKLDMNERQQIVDKIYKVSEEDNEKYLIKFRNRLEKYDRKENFFELKGEFPVPRDSHSTIAIGNKLIVYGGDSGYQYHGNIDILDMETMTWSKLRIQGSSPGVWAGHAAVNIGTKVYIIRGVGEKRYYNDIWIFDICTCSWTQLYITGQLHGLSTYITTCFLFLAVLLYEVNKISGSVLSVQTSDSRSKKYSGRALCRHGIVAFRDDTRLQKGGPISAGLLEAIEGSQGSTVGAKYSIRLWLRYSDSSCLRLCSDGKVICRLRRNTAAGTPAKSTPTLKNITDIHYERTDSMA
ncbi:uncharacterized protein [Arachis hypogaea]|uniref:uncharacterized protein isoform X1 n=1 Tax=Arachis hypogaea TaxID=3818 RepID=UPI000DEC6C19|nr:uncharacterized protein LOC112789967 isoform X4 [Arachis hypogaea]